MKNKRRISIIIIILILITLIFGGFFYYVMTFEPEAEQEYQAKKEEAIVQVVENEDSICKDGVIKEDINHEIPEYSYNDVIGSLTFVNSDFEVPILYGNPSEDFMTAMEYGGAYDPTSSYPGGDSTTVIAGHKNSDFKQLEHVEIGDAFVLNVDGNLYTYEVTDMQVIEDTDINKVYYDENDLVIYTCYPFTHEEFYSQRYMVVAEQVSQVSC